MSEQEPKILVSACLLGFKTNYKGEGKEIEPLMKLRETGGIEFICPEQIGGLSTPREEAEIEQGKTAQDVLEGIGRVITKSGVDVTEQFVNGAKQTLEMCERLNIKIAVLKARSPSCGKEQVYDGTFSGNKIPGMGVTAELLKQNGIEVFDEEHIPELLEKI